MLIELSAGGVIALNILVWGMIQFGLAWAFTQVAAERFNYRSLFARGKSWECDGRIYDRLFAIKRWKDNLPDASRMFRGGFAKAKLHSSTPEYLERFLRETWRGELTHWSALLAIPLFCIWNPWWGVLVNAAFALAVNFPCVLAQRYNRARLERLLAIRKRRSARAL